MTEVSATNSTGELAHTAGIVYGISTASALRDLVDQHAGATPATIARQATAVYAALGQLAVLSPKARTKILGAATKVASTRQSLTAIEPIFLSALLGSDDPAAHADAAQVWNRLTDRPAGQRLIPVFDPATGTLVFLRPDDVAALPAATLRERLHGLCVNKAVLPGSTADIDRLAERILHAASAVASLPVVARRDASDPQVQEARAQIAPELDSPGLPGLLASGSGLLVDLALTAAEDLAAPDSSWNSLWPKPQWSPSPDPVSQWGRAVRCTPVLPVVGAGLRGLVLHNGTALVLQAVPHLDEVGTLLTPGMMPASEAEPGAVINSWRRQARDQRLHDPFIDDPDSVKIEGGQPLHVLIAHPVDVFGTLIPTPPGTEPGYGLEHARRALVRTARSIDVPTSRISTADLTTRLLETATDQYLL